MSEYSHGSLSTRQLNAIRMAFRCRPDDVPLLHKFVAWVNRKKCVGFLFSVVYEQVHGQTKRIICTPSQESDRAARVLSGQDLVLCIDLMYTECPDELCAFV